MTTVDGLSVEEQNAAIYVLPSGKLPLIYASYKSPKPNPAATA